MKNIEGYSMPETVMIWILLGSIVLTLLSGLMGCSVINPDGGEIYIGTRRVDSYTAVQSMEHKGLRCIFTDCDREVRNDK